MSSPSIKVQTLIRKFKNGIKESLDKQRIINDFTYCLTVEDVLTSSILINEKKLDDFLYNVDDLIFASKSDSKSNSELKLSSNSNSKSNSKLSSITESASPKNSMPINIFSKDVEDINQGDDLLFSFSPNIYIKPQSRDSITDYVGENGYMRNIYNAEHCDNKWILMMYFMNRLYPNFATIDKIKIKSLHIHCLPGTELSAMHHFLYNSKMETKFSSIEWEWIGTINNIIEDPYKLRKELKKTRAQNLLNLFDDNIYSANNLKYIINETLNKIGKVNFAHIDLHKNAYNSIRDFIAYAILCIKLLETSCVVQINLDNPDKWDMHTINGIILLGLLFQEMYLFQFNFEGNLYTVLICKNKKKINTETLYKKLMLVSESTYLDTHNLFPLEYVRNEIKFDLTLYDLLKNINSAPTTFGDIIYEINKVLDMNVNTFL